MLQFFNMHWFDTREGKLIVGDPAYEEAVQNSLPGDIVPLVDLLLRKEFGVDTHEYEPYLYPQEKSREDCLIYGMWILKILEEAEGEPPDIAETHLRRLSRLKLGVGSDTAIKPLGGNMRTFRNAIGVRNRFSKQGRYDEWTIDQFLHNTEKLINNLGRVPTTEDFLEWSRQGKGPGRRARSRVGGANRLLDLLGFPDTARMAKDDIVDWGARVMQSNSGEIPSWPYIVILSRRKRGPSDRTIYKFFPGYADFQRAVQTEYEHRTTRIRERGDLESIYETVAGLLDPKLTKNNFSVARKKAIAARFEVAKACLPGIPHEDIAFLALKSSGSSFAEKLQAIQPKLTPALIEIMAVTEDLYDEIWPTADPDKQHLHVSEEELAAFRNETAAHRNRYKRS